MSISIRMIDDAGTESVGGSPTNSFSFPYFGNNSETFGELPEDGDAIVVVICTDQGGNTVASVTDGIGNTYRQLPGAFISSNSNGASGNGFAMDIWYAENIIGATAPPSSFGDLPITVHLNGPAAHVGVSVFDVVGINGGNKNSATSSVVHASNPQSGPALTSSDSQALYITALTDLEGTSFNNTNPGTGWQLGNHSDNPDLPLDSFVVGYAVGYLIGTGNQQTSWEQDTTGFPASFTAAVFGIAGEGDSGGNSGGGAAGPSAIYLGKVRVVGSAPSGRSNPFLGTVTVIDSVPSGQRDIYLGQVVEVESVPSPNNNNPSLGQVVIVDSPPAGNTDPFLGSVIASS